MNRRSSARTPGTGWRAWCLGALVALMAGLVAAPVVADNENDPFGVHTPIVVVMDTSGSMDESVGNPYSPEYARIQAARSAVLDLVANLGNGQPFGLLGYPGRDAAVVDGCPIGRVEIAPGALDVGAAAAAVRRLTPDGNTPTGPALDHAARLIRDTYGQDARGVIVLVSDGESNCGEIPVCEVAKEIRASGLEVQINTVGLNLTGAAEEEMRCVADATGGRYIDAGSGSGTDLSAAIAASAQAALSLTVSAPDRLRVVSGLGGGGGGEFSVTVRSTGRVPAADVRVSLVVRNEYDGESSTVLVPRPVRFLGNLDVGASRTLTFAVRPDDRTTIGSADWTVTATAANAAPAIADGRSRLEGEVYASQLGGILAGVDSVVVLGDSYSSGEGASGSYEEGTAGEDGESACHRSDKTYAHEIWGEDTTVIACSGAVTADFFAPQESGDVSMEPQLLALRELMLGDDPPEAVVLSIGGNDAGFGQVAGRCVYGNYFSEPLRPSLVWPLGWRCDQGVNIGWSGARTTTTDALESAMGVETDIIDVLRSVDAAVNDAEAQRGPAIPIIVMPYPRIVPETQPGNTAPSGCALGIGGDELAYLNTFLDALNTSVSLAAYTVRNEGRPVYIATDVVDAFQPDHTVCEGGDLSYAVTVSTDSLSRTSIESVLQVMETQELLHPTPDGHTAMARALVSWSQGPAAQPFDTIGTPVWKPYITRNPPNDLGAFIVERFYGLDTARTQAGGSLAVHADGFLPATTVRIHIESDPRALGTAITDADGAISTVVRLPSDIPTGDHHSVVIGTDPDGNLRAVAGEVVVLPQGGPLLYLWLGLGVLLTITGAALRPWRRRTPV